MRSRVLGFAIIQDNNYAPELMVGDQKSIDRSSPIVP